MAPQTIDNKEDTAPAQEAAAARVRDLTAGDFHSQQGVPG
jgi:hypothetical protein